MLWRVRVRKRLWSGLRPTATLFVILCGLVAFLYLSYRIGLVGFSVFSFQQGAAAHRASVCANDESRLTDPEPLLSQSYQDRIQKLQKLSPNLIQNPKFEQVEAGMPVGYARGAEEEGSAYTFLREGQENFLRTMHTKAPDVPAWLPEMTVADRQSTYAYSMTYRSSTPVRIILEYFNGIGDGGERYKKVAVLPASQTWKTVWGHVGAAGNLLAFRTMMAPESSGFVDTKEYAMYKVPSAQLDAGMVSIAFDDGWQSVDGAAKRLLDAYRYKTTQYIISDVAMSREPGYMDIGMITRLKAEGHEVGAHSLTHCNQTLLSESEVARNAQEGRRVLEQQGLGPIHSFAYPLGQYNQLTQGIYPKVYPYVRSSDAGYNDRYFDETNIRSMAIIQTTSDDEVKKWLEAAKNEKQWVVLVYHRVDEQAMYNVSAAQLERHLELIKQSGLDVRTVSEAASGIRR